MALFNKNSETTAAEATQEALDYLDSRSGDGMSEIGTDQTQVPLLKLVQTNSQEFTDGLAQPGDWINSVTKESYGPVVSVIPIQFKVAWYEWLPDLAGLAGRYEVGAIPIEGDPYTGMKNPATGNTVHETWLYALLIDGHLDDGLVLYSSTRTNIKYLKKWNTRLTHTVLPGGKVAPIYGAVWDWKSGRDKNAKGQYFSLIGGIDFNRWVDKDMFTKAVLPAREQATQQQLEYKPEAPEGVAEASSSVGSY